MTGETIRTEYGDLISDADASVLSGPFAEHMAQTTRASVATGIWGWFDDDVACLSGWGFGLDAISRPTTIWQGRDDRFVAPAHGQWLAAHVPGARFESRPEDGHLSLAVGAYGDVLDALLRDDQTHSRT